MNAVEFRRRVMQAGRNLPEWSLTYALQHYVEVVARYANEDVYFCVQLAGQFKNAVANVATHQDDVVSTEGGDLLPPPTKMTKVTIASLLRQIQLPVDTIRTHLTGSAAPPRRSLEEMVLWFEERNRTHGSHVIDDWQAWSKFPPTNEEIRNCWQDEFDEWLYGPSDKPARSKKHKRPSLWRHVSEEEANREHHMALLDDLLDHIRRRSAEKWPALWKWPGNLMPVGQPPIAYLECATRELARQSGFRQTDLVVYVLAGIIPGSLPNNVSGHKTYRIVTCPVGPGDSWAKMEVVPGRSWPEMKPMNPVTSEQGFRTLYKQVRQALGIHNRAELSEDDVRFLELVHSLGGPWEGESSKAHWLTVNEAWKKMAGKGYADWRSVRNRYNRLQLCLQHLLTGSAQGA